MSAGVALLVFILAFVIFSMALKVPVPFGLAIASLFVFLGTNMNPITVAQYSFASLDSFALLAIPFYIFAGVLMEYSGISKLVVNWIQSIIGRIRGSLGIICTVTCMAFGVLTGSAMATISAIGKVMAPEMDKDGYPKSYTAALLSRNSHTSQRSWHYVCPCIGQQDFRRVDGYSGSRIGFHGWLHHCKLFENRLSPSKRC